MLVRILGTALLLIIIIFLFEIFVGFPVIQDNYVEIQTGRNSFVVFEDAVAICNLRLIPEVLDRLIIEIKFDEKNKSDELIVHDLLIKLYDAATQDELERIFDIRVFAPDTLQIGFFDEIRLNESFDEIGIDSKFRKPYYTIQPQFYLEECNRFRIQIKAHLSNTKSNKDIRFEKSFIAENRKLFVFERFRVH